MTPPAAADYRDKVLYALALVATAVVLPFSLVNFYNRFYLLGALSAIVVAVLVVNAAAIYRGGRPPVPMGVAFGFILVGVAVSVWQRGLLGIFWTFPAILLFHFVVERRTANLFNLTLVAVIGVAVWNATEPEMASRILAAQILTIAFANIFSYAVDAEQKKETEQRRRLDLLVRATQAGFFEWERDGNRATYSPRLKEMLGFPADADASRWPPFSEFIHPEDRDERVRLFQKGARSRGDPGTVLRHVPGEHRLLHASGAVLWVQVEGLFIYGPDRRATRYIAAMYDVSELHRKQEELRAAIRVREEVERIARHDLKTPLNSILAVPRLLRQRGRLDEELLGMVEGAAYRMLDMINLSVDLYRMEQGEYRFSPRAVDLTALVEGVWREVRAHADSKQLQLDHRLPSPLLVWGEPLLCYSLLANLIKNAVEASPDGGKVTIEGHAIEGRITLRVRNEGVVPVAVRERFFQKYATHGKAGGFGLGTYSARLMARVQSGEVTMETSEAAGTTLTLTLGAAPAASSEAPRESALPPLRVLVVDDDEFNIMFMRATLPSPPLVIDAAVNGRAALDAARAHAPDVVFMDLEMPVMDGFQALAALRALESAKRATIVAFSSHDDPGIRQKCLDAGFDAYLAKPAARERIDEILGAAGAVPASVDPDLADALPGFLRSRKALAIELEAALDGQRREEARARAHKLAGSLSLYGFHWAADVARRLQARALDGDLGELKSQCRVLQRHLDAIGEKHAKPKEAAAG